MHDGTSWYRKQQRFSARRSICWWISRCFLYFYCAFADESEISLPSHPRTYNSSFCFVADLKLVLLRLICIWIIWEYDKWSKISNKNTPARPAQSPGSSVVVVLETESCLSILMCRYMIRSQNNDGLCVFAHLSGLVGFCCCSWCCCSFCSCSILQRKVHSG